MSRFAPPAWVLSALAVAALFAGIIYGDRILRYWYANDAHNGQRVGRVVDMLRRCELVIGDGRVFSKEGDYCERYYGNRDQSSLVTVGVIDLTIRPDRGASYKVSVPGNTGVSVGDQWPP
jgi:hypothetical protein